MSMQSPQKLFKSYIACKLQIWYLVFFMCKYRRSFLVFHFPVLYYLFELKSVSLFVDRAKTMFYLKLKKMSLKKC